SVLLLLFYLNMSITDIALCSGCDHSVEVFDLNVARSIAVIPDAHCRAAHQIIQNKGSSFSTQQSEAYNLFLTTAVTEGIKLWDLRTLRCVRRFDGHHNRCHPCGISISPCGKYIATGSENKCAYVFDIRCSNFLNKLSRCTDTVMQVAFNPSKPQPDLLSQPQKIYCLFYLNQKSR
uniref:Uncharacterized protein n=1 Tax=Erpetoichthys calabaricus TaxID=27687 RepID=A0A8C4THW9_ERPCA